jgi:hypothetical protein
MLERSVQTADDFRGGLKKCPRFRLVDSLHVVTEMLNQFPELASNIRGMGLRFFGFDRLHQYYFARRPIERRISSCQISSALIARDHESIAFAVFEHCVNAPRLLLWRAFEFHAALLELLVGLLDIVARVRHIHE